MKHILLAVLGISPQIITETIYKLHHENIPISEVFVITTLVGRKTIYELLLDPKYGKLYELEKTLNTKIKLSDENIIVPEINSIPLDDIKDSFENSIMAQTIFETTEKLTSLKNTTIHASIAGGRKTMGAYLYLAMQLYGREQDKCYHIITDEIAEKSREFFFPQEKILKSFINGKDVFFNASKSSLFLAEIPIVPFKKVLSHRHYDLILEKIETAFEQKDINNLIVNLPKNTIKWNNHFIKLTPAEISLYYLLLKKRITADCEISCPGCKKCGVDIYYFTEEKNFDDLLSAIKIGYNGEKGHYFSFLKKKESKEFFTTDYFRQYISRINKKIYKITLNKIISIDRIANQDNSLYGIFYPKNLISILSS